MLSSEDAVFVIFPLCTTTVGLKSDNKDATDFQIFEGFYKNVSV